MLFSGISYASVCRVEILVCRCIEFLRRGIATKSHLCDDFSARTRCGNARDACNRKAESDSSTRREVRATACSRVIAGTRRAGGSSVILLLFSRSFALSLFFFFLSRSDVRFDRFHGWSASTIAMFYRAEPSVL